jgi:hypothetical protein
MKAHNGTFYDYDGTKREGITLVLENESNLLDRKNLSAALYPSSRYRTVV